MSCETLSCLFQIADDIPADSGVLDIALGAHYLTVDGSHRLTPELEQHLHSFPEWTTPIAWAATYEKWTF